MPHVTQDQIEEQKKLGLDIGCHACLREGEEIPFPPTYKWLNPFCVRCKKLYCAKHRSEIDIHFCADCLPGLDKN